MIFLSDQGVQYIAENFQKDLRKNHVSQSMSRKGNCWDNAVDENFFKILKSEMVDHEYYYSFAQARNVIFEFIEVWYYRKRIHSVFDYKSPEQFMELYNHKVA